MWQYLLKVTITSVIVVAIAEIGKRNTLWAAVLASLPLTSLLAFIWLYVETKNTEQIAALSLNIFWLVLPSLPLFLLLPALLRLGLNFGLSLGVSCLTAAACYFAMVWTLTRLGMRG